MEAVHYGFFGQKPLEKITDRISKNEIVKMPHNGNYLYKGKSLETYEEIKKQVGEDVILTSGIRGVMKQFLLFLNKAYLKEGNLSLASRSLAPPGYSFHGKGDFDVGQLSLGADNFTARFATTEVYQRLCDLGYLKLRYPQDNMLGVRFEPWHIKIT
jgi:LAS superfamily LD-carboxypeptidase LdcB